MGRIGVFEACYAKSLQSCPTLCDLIDGSPPGSPVPGILQARNTGVGCHFLLQCMKVESEREVAQSCPTPSDPMDCSLPGSSVHGIFQARVLEWGAIAFSPYRIVWGNFRLRIYIHLFVWLWLNSVEAQKCRWNVKRIVENTKRDKSLDYLRLCFFHYIFLPPLS